MAESGVTPLRLRPGRRSADAGDKIGGGARRQARLPAPAPPLPAFPSTVRYATVRGRGCFHNGAPLTTLSSRENPFIAASLSALFFAVAPPVPLPRDLPVCVLGPSGPVWVVGVCWVLLASRWDSLGAAA